MGSDGDTVGRAVASDSRGLQFECSQATNLFTDYGMEHFSKVRHDTGYENKKKAGKIQENYSPDKLAASTRNKNIPTIITLCISIL